MEAGKHRQAAYLKEQSTHRRLIRIIPRITGSAYVNADATLILDPNDHFRFGIA